MNSQERSRSAATASARRNNRYSNDTTKKRPPSTRTDRSRLYGGETNPDAPRRPPDGFTHPTRSDYLNLGHAEDLAGALDAETREQHVHAVLDAARSAGVLYVDAARSYGGAEQFLASWLKRRRLRPGEITIGSKWNPRRRAATATFIDALRDQMEATRALLGSHLSLYQLHSLRLEGGVLDDRSVLDELDRLRNDGLAIGFSVRGPTQAEAIRRALETGRFDAVQATWNLLERSAGPALAQAHAAGLGVIVKEALANGRLTSRGEVAGLKDVARERDVTPDKLALAAALAQPWAGVVLSGAATAETFRSNTGALDVDYDAALDERLAALAEDADAYWSARARLEARAAAQAFRA